MPGCARFPRTAAQTTGRPCIGRAPARPEEAGSCQRAECAQRDRACEQHWIVLIADIDKVAKRSEGYARVSREGVSARPSSSGQVPTVSTKYRS